MIDTDVLVFNEIRRWKIANDGRSPSLGDVARALSLSKTAISNSLTRLKFEGLIKTTSRGNGRRQKIELVGERLDVEYTPPPMLKGESM